MADRSSRPTAARIGRRRAWNAGSSRCVSSAGGGLARIAYLLGLNVSTVHNVLRRYGVACLRRPDRPTGRVIRRMESQYPGELVHVDVKKLGKIPAVCGWRMVGRPWGAKPPGR